MEVAESNKTDILFVHHLPVVGGATHSLMLLIKAALRKDFKVKVVFLRPYGNAIEWYQDEDIEVEIIDIASYAHAHGAYRSFLSRRPWHPVTELAKALLDTGKARQYLGAERPRLVYLNTSVLIPFARAAKSLNIPVVWHIREQLHPGNVGIRRAIIRRCVKRNADLVLSISLTNAMQLKLNNTEVVYNSVNSKFFSHYNGDESFLQKFKISEKDIIFSFLGGNVKSKGVNLFVEAAIYAVNKGLNSKFIIAGNINLDLEKGPINTMDKKVQALLSNTSQSIRDRFIFTGTLNDVVPVLSVSYALVWPALVPHFSRPIIEAMATGIPFIATRFDSTTEIVDSGKEGILVSRDSKEIGEAMMHLVVNRVRSKIMGNNGFEKAKRLFDAEKNNELIIRKICGLLNG